MAEPALTTGIKEIDNLVGGVLPGDNIVWEVDSGAPVDQFISGFLAADGAPGSTITYVSFNRSPQTITRAYGEDVAPGGIAADRLLLLGQREQRQGVPRLLRGAPQRRRVPKRDESRLGTQFRVGDPASAEERPGSQNAKERVLGTLRSSVIHVANPSDPAQLQNALTAATTGAGAGTRYVFDSLTGMLDLWADEDVVLRFFGHICPLLFDLSTVAYWFLETEAHSQRFLAKVRHITQVVLEIGISRGIRTLTLRKAANRRSTAIGVPQWFRVVEGKLAIAAESREDRELSLLTRMGEALGTALVPNSFFEETMNVLASELGMIRGTVVLLDRVTSKLRIVAAHGLSSAERARGEYDVGEGITGHVVKTGQPEVVPDIRKDARFLNRTTARQVDSAWPIAFICVPLKVDNETVGALSVDRPFAVESTLDKDLRLLSIVASLTSQVLKINRLLQVDKEEILVRDERMLRELRSRYRLENLIGQSKAIQQVLVTAATAAMSNAPILISGETGTGKELVANVIHYNSRRSKGPLVKVNCGALPETLLESELFGHVKGRLHRGRPESQGPVRAGRPGHALSRRSLRNEPAAASEALAGAAGRRVRAGRRHADDPRGRADRGGDEHESERGGAAGPVPRGPLLPAQRRADPSAAAARAPRGHSDARGPLPGEVQPRERQVRDEDLAGGPGSSAGLLLARQRARAGELRRARRRDEPRQHALDEPAADRDSRQRAHPGPGPKRSATNGMEGELEAILERHYKTAEDSAGAREQLHDLIERLIIARALAEGMSQRTLAAKLSISRTTFRKRLQEYGLGE